MDFYFEPAVGILVILVVTWLILSSTSSAVSDDLIMASYVAFESLCCMSLTLLSVLSFFSSCSLYLNASFSILLDLSVCDLMFDSNCLTAF